MNKSSSLYLIVAALMAALSIAFGAMGAHSLKNIMDAESLLHIETAAKYQMYMALFIAVVALIHQQDQSKILRSTATTAIAGNMMFSLVLYTLAFVRTYFSGERMGFGIIIPIGGVLMISSTLMLAFYAFRSWRS